MIWLSITIMGMIGGQINKAVRRYGIATVSVFYGLYKKTKEKKYLLFLLFAPILSSGYGENSLLMKIFRRDWIVRIVYAFILSAPLMAYDPKHLILYPICLAGAFSVRAGGFKIYKYDFLYEDFIRYLTIGLLVQYAITGGVSWTV